VRLIESVTKTAQVELNSGRVASVSPCRPERYVARKVLLGLLSGRWKMSAQSNNGAGLTRD